MWDTCTISGIKKEKKTFEIELLEQYSLNQNQTSRALMGIIFSFTNIFCRKTKRSSVSDKTRYLADHVKVNIFQIVLNCVEYLLLHWILIQLHRRIHTHIYTQVSRSVLCQLDQIHLRIIGSRSIRSIQNDNYRLYTKEI